MKRNKQTFNALLRRYHKYLRKIENLRLADRNERRQNILAKHIERLYEKLMSLKLSLTKGTIVAATVVGALAFAPQQATAQTFNPAQPNPFGLADIGYTSSPTLADLDNDGDLDLMTGEDLGNFYYFENTGTSSAPVYGPAQLNPFGLSDIGERSSPTLADLDNDGDLDLISGDFPGDFYYFENTGTAAAPVYDPAQTNPFGLAKINAYSTPTFADLDNDGDLDLISGDFNGDFSYFENTGTAAAPVYGPAQPNPFGLANTGLTSSPILADLDGDGDLDLIAGDNSGDFYYFENTGTAAAPVYDPAQTNPFGLADIGDKSSPTFADLDNDGDLDLISGAYSGNFYYFENTTCLPTTATISPTETCSYTSPSGNYVWAISGNYMDTIPNTAGCDSLLTINLTINNPVDATTSTAGLDITANQTGATYQWLDCNNGNTAITGETNATYTATASGDYAVLVTVGSCSETSACVNVCLPTTATISPTATCSYTSPSGNYTWAMSGNYMDTIPNTAGCDSLLTINLTINPVDATTSTAGFDITANQIGAAYQWLDCTNGNTAITGATNATYTATANGDYAVLVTMGSCSETSACVNVIVTGINEFNQPDVTIFPNPITNQFTIDIENEADDVAVTIVSIEGKIVYNIDLLGNNKMVVDASTWNNGIYFVQIRSSTTLKTIKLIKQ